MNISNIINSPQVQNTNAAAQAGKNTLGKDAFLQLLVAQMKNQDPTNPMDGTKFATQLAQFNSVEQLINVNEGLDQLSKSQQQMSSGLSNTMAASLTGKEILAISNRVHIANGNKQVIPFRLAGTATHVAIKITDAAGNMVRTQKLENLSGGEHTWSWDGKSDDGTIVPEGTYALEIDAKNGEDKVNALTYLQGIAEKVRYTENGVRLMVHGVAVPLGDVQEIGG